MLQARRICTQVISLPHAGCGTGGRISNVTVSTSLLPFSSLCCAAVHSALSSSSGRTVLYVGVDSVCAEFRGRRWVQVLPMLPAWISPSVLLLLASCGGGWLSLVVYLSLFTFCVFIIGFCFVVTIRLTYNKYTRDKNKGIYIYY